MKTVKTETEAFKGQGAILLAPSECSSAGEGPFYPGKHVKIFQGTDQETL